MLKLMIFARRLPHLSREEFIDIYEKNHIPLVDDLVQRGIHEPMQNYKRNYLIKDHALSTQGSTMPSFDVVTEACFEREEDFRSTMSRIAADPASALAVQQDFAKYIDVTTMCYCVVETHAGGGEAR